MNPMNESNEINNTEKVIDLFLKGDEKLFDLALENDSHFAELIEIEESVQYAIKHESKKYLDSLIEKDSKFFESLDLAKANASISKEKIFHYRFIFKITWTQTRLLRKKRIDWSYDLGKLVWSCLVLSSVNLWLHL